LDFLAAALFDFAMMLSRFWAWGIVSARHMPADRPPELSLEKPPPGTGGIRSLTEGAERRKAHLVVPAFARQALADFASFGGRALNRGERDAFRRSTAAILGFGTVLPGSDGGLFARPIPRLSPRSSFPRPAIEGRPT
jgi:hypothetical protein